MSVYKLDRYSFKYQYDCWWSIIFFHNSSTGSYFSKTDPLRNPLSCSTIDLYSYIGDLNDRYRVSGKFEFILEYLELKGYNRWTQTLNPLKAYEGMSDEEIGYSPVGTLSWPYRSFSAMHQPKVATKNTCFMCISNEVNWHYAIGAYDFYSEESTFPGPFLNENQYV